MEVSVAGSAGHAVEVQGVAEVPQVRARAVVVGNGQSGWSRFARNFSADGPVVHAQFPSFSEGRLHSCTQSCI